MNNVSSWGKTCRYYQAKLLIMSSDREELKPEPGILTPSILSAQDLLGEDPGVDGGVRPVLY